MYKKKSKMQNKKAVNKTKNRREIPDVQGVEKECGKDSKENVQDRGRVGEEKIIE